MKKRKAGRKAVTIQRGVEHRRKAVTIQKVEHSRKHTRNKAQGRKDLFNWTNLDAHLGVRDRKKIKQEGRQ